LLNQQNAHQNEIIRKDIDNIMKGAYKKINEKKYNEAITILNNVIDTYPKFPDGYIAKADINFILKNYKNSLIDYNKAINLGNSTPELYLKIANTQYNLGLFKDAASNYIQFLRINPQDEYAYYRLMGSYIFIEDFKKAFDYLQKYKDYSITKDIQISDFNEWDNILNKYKKYDLIRDLENGLKSLKFVQEKKQI
jgi:tetratricopeptide (TPR) repeat protein